MKKKNIVFIAPLMIFLLSSCLDEQKAIYGSLALVEQYGETDSDFNYILDNGDTIVPLNYKKEYEDSSRVYVEFYEPDNLSGTDTKYETEITWVNDVLYKEVFELLPEYEDSIGNDPVIVKNIWFTNDIINVQFQYLASDQSQYINLTREEGEIDPTADTLRFEFRHNDLDSYGYNSAISLSSFDLREFKSEEKTEQYINIVWNQDQHTQDSTTVKFEY